MRLRGKRILILESDYIVAHAIQRVMENDDATVHVGAYGAAMHFDGVIVDWRWARGPLLKILSEAGMPILPTRLTRQPSSGDFLNAVSSPARIR